MGIKCTPITIRTPITVSIDITAIETEFMTKLAPMLVDIISNLSNFTHNTTEPIDDAFGFEVKGDVIQDGTLIHIDADGLNPPEDSIEPDDIEFTEKDILPLLQKYIVAQTSGDTWKNMIARSLKLSIHADTEDRKLNVEI